MRVYRKTLQVTPWGSNEKMGRGPFLCLNYLNHLHHRQSRGGSCGLFMLVFNQNFRRELKY
ncbi:hypothetical protein BpHYR1_023875 [Brachionus plicatilis]|uniref:Uncharacterized protein n=1 Tax=Brachionus plicatilis TaxID=10195 RepID=A0A3M7QNX8_BRAPC|nr:hypothetical protein BpHYR1_023875 [Brachionus plicatilis]